MGSARKFNCVEDETWNRSEDKNIGTSKSKVFSSKSLDELLQVKNKEIKNVAKFVQLGSLLISNNNCTLEIQRRIGKAIGAMSGLKVVWKSEHISPQ